MLQIQFTRLIFGDMGIWKLSDFWTKISKVLKLLAGFLTMVFLIDPDTHVYIWITATAGFTVECIDVLFDDKDGDGLVDIFQWKNKIKDK
jgi:hypothetical protein